MSEDTRNMDDIPDWAFNMVVDGINKLNITDAAHVMIGCDPREEIHLKDISISTRRREMLYCAADQLNSWILDNKLLTTERDSHGIPFFSVDHLRNLAIAEGWCWDIPSEKKVFQLIEGHRRSKIDATLAALKPHYKDTKNTQSGHESAAIEEPSPLPAVAPTTPDLDPTDLPEELDAANMAFRAVLNGYGNPADTFRNRLVEYLNSNFHALGDTAIGRIATVANPDKARGRPSKFKE